MTFGLEFQKYVPGQLMAKGRRSMRREHVPSPTARTSNIPTSCAQDPINNHLLSNGVLDTLKKASGEATRTLHDSRFAIYLQSISRYNVAMFVSLSTLSTVGTAHFFPPSEVTL